MRKSGAYAIYATIFKMSNDRTAESFLALFSSWCTPSGIFMFSKDLTIPTCIVIFNVYVFWKGFGFRTHIVEVCVLSNALLHIFVGLTRRWDLKLPLGLLCGKLNFVIVFFFGVEMCRVLDHDFSPVLFRSVREEFMATSADAHQMAAKIDGRFWDFVRTHF